MLQNFTHVHNLERAEGSLDGHLYTLRRVPFQLSQHYSAPRLGKYTDDVRSRVLVNKPFVFSGVKADLTMRNAVHHISCNLFELESPEFVDLGHWIGSMRWVMKTTVGENGFKRCGLPVVGKPWKPRLCLLCILLANCFG